MNNKTDKASPAALIAIFLVALSLLAYLAGYFLLGRREFMPGTKKQERVVVFKREWEARVYQPMTTIETKLTGVRTHCSIDAVYGVLSE